MAGPDIPDEQPASAAGAAGATAPLIPVLIGVVLVVLLFAVLTAGLTIGSDDADDATPRAAAGESSDEPVDDGDTAVKAAGEPTLQIHPQRARVGVPLQLEARGTGCGGRQATLSVIGLGAPTATAGLDRLVVRRRVDVDEEGNWSTSPLLVAQPVGTYRVTASCDRRAVIDGAEPLDNRRDVFTAAEVLELTGPAVLYELEVSPAVAPPGQAVTVRLAGRDECPPGAQVNGTLVPTPGTPGAARPFQATVDPTGRWTTTVAFAARDAHGSYGVEARCSSGFAYATGSIRFPVPDEPPRLPFPLPGSGSGSGRPTPGPATPIPGRPSYTG